jgi:hypothetical protein
MTNYIAAHIRSMVELLASLEVDGPLLKAPHEIRQDAFDAMEDLADALEDDD